MLQQIIDYFKNVMNSYIVLYYDPYYNHKHYYDGRLYFIKETVYKNGKVQISSPDKI